MSPPITFKPNQKLASVLKQSGQHKLLLMKKRRCFSKIWIWLLPRMIMLWLRLHFSSLHLPQASFQYWARFQPSDCSWQLSSIQLQDNKIKAHWLNSSWPKTGIWLISIMSSLVVDSSSCNRIFLIMLPTHKQLFLLRYSWSFPVLYQPWPSSLSSTHFYFSLEWSMGHS